jgi:hypothetical protein
LFIKKGIDTGKCAAGPPLLTTPLHSTALTREATIFLQQISVSFLKIPNVSLSSSKENNYSNIYDKMN